MNREIIFRGKSLVTNEWVYGSLVKCGNENHIIGFDEVDLDGHHIRYYSDRPVFTKQETIGQFTGLKDKNGKEIYEGDILKFFYIPYYSRYDITLKVYRVGEVAFVNGCFRLVNFPDYDDIDLNTKSELQPCEGSEIEIHSNFCSVIGNIHDNKDLLNEI